MAKLGAYFGLCPLIDHKSLQGISLDKKDEDTNKEYDSTPIIVTLGKNIAIKFSLADQKQLFSWRTKYKFISPIIYDEELNKYVAAFNENFIRTWSDCEKLDKLKKIKFSDYIFTLISCASKTFIVFKNGAVMQLIKALENRKNLSLKDIINPQTEDIVEVLKINIDKKIYIGLIVKSSGDNFLYWTQFDENGQQNKFSKISLKRDRAELSGYVFHNDNEAVYFLSLWSDGRMHSVILEQQSETIGDLFTVVESIACEKYVSMASLDQNYIAMYGCNLNEEGALVVLFNVQFKVIQSKLSFKLYTSEAKLWRINNHLLLPVGQSLAVVPFHLDVEQLAALVGSHKVTETILDADILIVDTVQFSEWTEKETEDPLEKLDPKMQDLALQGYSNTLMFEVLFAELQENTNVEEIKKIITHFDDISEEGLVKVLKLVLNIEQSKFVSSTINTFKNFPQKLQPDERAELVDLILTKGFNAALILPFLRSVLNLDEVLALLQYFNFLLTEDGHTLPSTNFVETETKIIEWICILLDANYQNFILTKDEHINDTLKKLKNVFKESFAYCEETKDVVSLLAEVKKGKSLQKITHFVGLNYSIKEFPLYE